MKFHIAKNGAPAKCTAEVRACPVGGEDQHFATADEAQTYVMQKAMAEAMEEFNQDHYLTDEAMDEMDSNSTVSFDDDWDADIDYDAIIEGWEEEELALSVDRDLAYTPPTAEEMASYQTAEEEALALVRKTQEENMAMFNSMPTEWGVELFDKKTSEEAAAALSSYSGMKALGLLADDLEAQAYADHEAGKTTDLQLREELEVVSAFRFLINPLDGRRRGEKKDPKPIDPQLIQALRCLYMKRFGVDPFEAGVTVPQLLQMRQQRLI